MNTISLNTRRHGATVLHGAAIAAPFKGARYDQKTGPGETVDETLELVLENGTPATISAGYAAVEKYLTAARQHAQIPGSRPVYLEVVPLAGEGTWRSEVLGGWAEKCGGSRGSGSVGLLLHLTRVNFWEGAEAQVPLSSQLESRSLNPLSIYTHDDADAGHNNWLGITGTDILGDLPAPVRVNLYAGAGDTISRVYLGLDNQTAGNWFQVFYEAEAGTGGGNQANGASSGGIYRACAWNDTGETELIWWSIIAADVRQASARFFKALLRVQGGTGYSNLWAKLRVKNGSVTVWDGPWVLVPTGAELVELSAIQVPPYLQELEYYAGLTVVLVVKRATAGAHSLAVDYLQLMPMDGYRKLVTRGGGLVQTDYLQDDSINQAVYTGESLGQSDWLGYGEWLYLLPGVNARLYIDWLEGNNSPVTRYLGTELYYRPRKRNL